MILVEFNNSMFFIQINPIPSIYIVAILYDFNVSINSSCSVRNMWVSIVRLILHIGAVVCTIKYIKLILKLKLEIVKNQSYKEK